nr:phospholipase-like protein [Tanacetum cinerariifolium]
MSGGQPLTIVESDLLMAPRVLVTCRKEFYLVTGLRFGVENLADYNDDELPIPFRRRVFPSSSDGVHITGNTKVRIIEDELFDRLHDDDVVSLCCLGILQLVLLGVEGKRRIPDWMLRLANNRTLAELYATQPTTEIDKKPHLIFGYTWAFKTWILETFRVTTTKYYNRYNRYSRVAAWKKGEVYGNHGSWFFSWKYACCKIDTRRDRGSIGLVIF